MIELTINEWVAIVAFILGFIFRPFTRLFAGNKWDVSFGPIQGKQVRMIGILDSEHRKIVISKVEEQ